jgi:hypothetical protein
MGGEHHLHWVHHPARHDGHARDEDHRWEADTKGCLLDDHRDAPLSISCFRHAILHLLDSYIDLFRSPICTLFIIFLYRKHLIDSCRLCKIDLPREQAHDAIHVKKIFLTIAAGFLSSFLLSIVCLTESAQHMIPLFCAMVTLASAGAMAEIVIHRILKGRIALINYSWFWYIGAWTYFVTRV